MATLKCQQEGSYKEIRCVMPSVLDPVIWLGWDRGKADWMSFGKYDEDAQQRLRQNIANVYVPSSERSPLDNDSRILLDAKDEAFLQCWLTFGLAESFLQSRLPDSALLSHIDIDGAPAQVLSLLEDSQGTLGSYLTCLISRFDDGSVDRSEWFEHARSTILACRGVLETLRASKGPVNGEIESLPSNALALVLQLAETLSCALFEIVEGNGDHVTLAAARELLDWSRFAYSARLAYQGELKFQGFCPRVLNCIAGLSLVSAWAAASSLTYDAFQSNHTMCTSTACKNLCAAEDLYGVVHVIPNCKCKTVKPDIREVFDLIEAGKVPIFDMVWEETHVAKIAVRDSKDKSYYAISHVWTEGLGSVTEVGLPTCQLNRFHERLGGHSFWIDALGVPLDKGYRKKAILSMASIYREAENVLVLDASMLKTNSNMSTPELLYRLYTSNWLSRLWTLQECLLSRVLVLALEDRNVPFLDVLKASFDQPIRTPLHKALCDEMMMLVPQLSSKSYEEGKGMSLTALASGLQNRSTSKTIDETVAISALANIEVKPLLDLDQDDRMVHFLKSMGNLPTDVIFGRVKRLARAGFTWAPQSLMQPLGLVAPSTAECTEEGIRATYNVLTFAMQQFKDKHIYHFIISQLPLAITVGLIRDGEVDTTGTAIDCDGLILAGNINVNTASSCPATGVYWSQNPTNTDESSYHCKFQSAGFIIIWDGGQGDQRSSRVRRIEATLVSRTICMV